MTTTWGQYSTSTRKWKGKERARDEGDGGSAGILVSLDMIGNGVYDVSYAVPVLVGKKAQKLSLQVDTGSSDLWIASTSCSTSACSAVAGHAYDPSGSNPTGVSFDIDYLHGNVSGPVVWDQIKIGGYTISNQALAAADKVENEALAPLFSGILGLALPRNSIIAESLPPGTSNTPDGAPFSSNIFGITPNAPASHFLSLCLSRPGSDRIPSYLGIGRHPSALIPDPYKIQYSILSSDSSTSFFWKASVKALSVWVNGEERSVSLGKSNSGADFPSAVLDSGVPLILTTSTVANGIYGALGVGPASDGKYYVPCKTPLNMTITLDGRSPISLHPLDLTAQPPQTASAVNCIGLIQPFDSQLASDNSQIGDMILGVPFLRNTYTVMAYDPPDDGGDFGTSPPERGTRPDLPRLGLLPLTDPKTALDEFHQVRVLNRPLDSHGTATGGKKMSVGVDVLIGLLSFFAFCFLLFALRWFLVRRSLGISKGGAPAALQNVGGGRRSDDQRKGRGLFGMGGYVLARRSEDEEDTRMTEDELRVKRFEAYLMKGRMLSEYTMSSGLTRVGDVDEFGYRDQDTTWPPKKNRKGGMGTDTLETKGQNPRAPSPSLWGKTLVGVPEAARYPDRSILKPRLSKEQPPLPNDEPEPGGGRDSQHQRGPSQDPTSRHLSTDQPLQAYQDFAAGGGSSQWTPAQVTDESFDPYREFAAGSANQPTHQRQQSWTDLPTASYLPNRSGHQRTASDLAGAQELTYPLLSASTSYFPSDSPPPQTRNLFLPQAEQQVDEFGALQDTQTSPTEEGGGIMAGVGTAMRSSNTAWLVDSESSPHMGHDPPIATPPIESLIGRQPAADSQLDRDGVEGRVSLSSSTGTPTGPRKPNSMSGHDR